MMSGPRAEKFAKGWALRIGSFGVAHYYRRRDLGYTVALCGRSRVAAGGLLEAGEWRRCRLCEQKGAPR